MMTEDPMAARWHEELQAALQPARAIGAQPGVAQPAQAHGGTTCLVLAQAPG